ALAHDDHSLGRCTLNVGLHYIISGPERSRLCQINPSPKIGENTSDTIAMSLIKMLSEGPAVSLKGSPTVSPTTAAAWASVPLPPWWPSSTYFFALSQAPPELAIMMPSKTPLTVAPAKSPTNAALPKSSPRARGATTAKAPGTIISFRAALVLISTHFAYSG